jgi:hypothetical protein
MRHQNVRDLPSGRNRSLNRDHWSAINSSAPQIMAPPMAAPKINTDRAGVFRIVVTPRTVGRQ